MIEPQVAVSGKARQRGQDLLIRYLITGSVNNILVSSIASLFLLALGASPVHLGLLATAMQLVKLLRLAGVQAMAHLGKTRLMMLGRVLTAAATAGLVGVAANGGRDMAAIWATLGVLTLRGCLLHTGAAAWWPLVQDNTASATIGSFLTRMRVRQRLVEVGLPVAVGWYLGAQPQPPRFAPLFAIAAAAALVSAWWIRGLEERRDPVPAGGLWKRVRDVLRVPAVGRYSLYLMARSFVYFASYPFFVVALTDRGMPVAHYVWMTSVLALGQILSLYFWGRLVDAHGSRPAITIASLSLMCMSPVWLVMPSAVSHLFLWALGFFLVYGMLEAGLQMGQTRAMMVAVPPERQGEGFAVVMYGSAVGGGLGGLVGGAVFEWISGGGHEVAGCEAGAVYLALSHVAMFSLWILSRRLTGYANEASVWSLLHRQRP